MSCSGVYSQVEKNVGRDRPWVKLLRGPVGHSAASALRRFQAAKELPPEEGACKSKMSAGVFVTTSE